MKRRQRRAHRVLLLLLIGFGPGLWFLMREPRTTEPPPGAEPWVEVPAALTSMTSSDERPTGQTAAVSSGAVDLQALREEIAEIDELLGRVTIRGRVVDGTGRGVPEAFVTVGQPHETRRLRVCGTSSLGADDPNSLLYDPRTTTDAQGRFVLERVRTGERTIHAYARASRRTSASVRVSTRHPPPKLLLELPTSAGITGVATLDGVPATGCAAVIWSLVDRPLSEVAKDGSFHITDLPPGTHRLLLVRPTTTWDLREIAWVHGPFASATLSVEAGETSRVRLDGSDRQVRVRGVLRRGGQPFAASLSLWPAGRPPHWPSQEWLTDCESDAQGRFERDLLPGRYRAHYYGETTVDLTFDVPAGVREHRVELSIPAGSISGRVLRGGTRRPLPGVEVVVVARDGSSPDQTPEPWDTQDRVSLLESKTDAQGRFVLAGVAEGTYHLVARLDDHAPRVLEVVVPANGQAEAQVTLEPEGKLAILLQDPDGKPLAGGLVTSHDIIPIPGDRLPDPAQYVGQLAAKRSGYVFNPDGTGKVWGLLPGPWLLIVTPHQHAPLAVPVHFTPDSERLVITLRQAGRVLVDVVDGRGRPVPDAAVSFRSPSNGVAIATSSSVVLDAEPRPSDQAGRVSCDLVAPGRYRVWARSGHRAASASAEVHPGHTTRVTVRLP